MAPAARTTDSTGSYALVDPVACISLSAAGTVDSYMVTSQHSVVESQSRQGSSSTPGDTVSEGHPDPYVEVTRRPGEGPAPGSLPPRHPVGRQAPTIDGRMGAQAGPSFTPKPRQGSRHRDRAASTSVIRESSKTHSARSRVSSRGPSPVGSGRRVPSTGHLPVYTSPLERLAHSQRQESGRAQPLRSPPLYGGVGPTPITVAMSPAPTQAYEDQREEDSLEHWYRTPISPDRPDQELQKQVDRDDRLARQLAEEDSNNFLNPLSHLLRCASRFAVA